MVTHAREVDAESLAAVRDFGAGVPMLCADTSGELVEVLAWRCRVGR